MMMVTSLALTADFIGGNVESSGNKFFGLDFNKIIIIIVINSLVLISYKENYLAIIRFEGNMTRIRTVPSFNTYKNMIFTTS